MTRSFVSKIWVILSLAVLPLAASAQTAKPLLNTKINFANDGSAKVIYDSHGIVGQDAESNKIETWLVFYAYAMHRLDPESGKALLNDIQASLNKIATEHGMVRADLLQGNPLLKPLQSTPVVQTLELAFSELPGRGHALELKPDTIDAKFVAPAVLYLLQDQVKTLSENGVRLMVLAMGGMNKWYREIGKAGDADSVAKAPAYALNLAVDILQKLGGKNGKKK